MYLRILLIIWTLCGIAYPQGNPVNSSFTIARLKYDGGGDWYNDPSIIPNILDYLQKNTNILTADDEVKISIMDENLFSYPFLFLTGHGNMSFSEKEARRLRNYLTSGGFLYADDDYGLDKHFRREMNKVFPDKKLLAVPFDHPIYSIHFNFSQGLPKIHEHDGEPPQGFAYFHNGRMVVFYSYSSNISDGWADPEVYDNPHSVREKALRMGSNIVVYALMY